MSKIISHRAVVAAAALAAGFISNLSNIPSAQAIEGKGLGTIKPMQAISFDVGDRRAVGYFLAESGNCNLVLTVADRPNWNEAESFQASRFEAAIPAGKTTRYRAEGPAIDFFCHAGALALSATAVKQIASGSIGE